MGGGGLPTGGQGSKVYVLCAEHKEHKRFRPGTRPGGIGFPAGRIGDRGDREIVYVPNVYVPFPAPTTVRHRQPTFLQNLVDVSDIFYFFLLGGGGRGVRGAGGVGCTIFY